MNFKLYRTFYELFPFPIHAYRTKIHFHTRIPCHQCCTAAISLPATGGINTFFIFLDYYHDYDGSVRGDKRQNV